MTYLVRYDPFREAALPKKISIKKEEPKELAEAR